MNTATNRFRGRAGRRIAATIVAAAALGLGATACGPEDDTANSTGSSTASTSQQAPEGQDGAEPASPGGDVDPAHKTVHFGKLGYLAHGKLTVKAESSDRKQAFLVSNATQILGASSICAGTDGSATTGEDGFGTSKCTVNDLEKAAQAKGSPTVRVTMDPETGVAKKVEEQYHP